MSTLTTFTCFPELPPELREMIWIEVLTASPSVYFAKQNLFPKGERQFPFFTRISKSPRAGSTSRESWSVLHKLCDRGHCCPKQLPLSGVCWDDFGKTIFHLGDWETGLITLFGVEPEFLERIEHVALWWFGENQMYEVCEELAKRCPKLTTIVMQRKDWRLQVWPDCVKDAPLDLNSTAFCEWIVRYEGPEITHSVPDGSLFRDFLMEKRWKDNRPKMHLV